MSVLLLVAGVLLIALTLLDALWTTLWLDGHAGPLAGRLSFGVHSAFVRLAGGHRRGGSGRVNHRLLSVTGPTVLVANVLLWVLLLWAGWAVLFSANPSSVVDSRTRAPASVVERIYFTGYTLATLGNGDFAPQGGGWQLATSVASLNGLLFLTLTVTYLLAVLEAVAGQRSFASQVYALGASAEDFVRNAWDGRGFGALELQLTSLVEQLNLITEQHQAYPMLHYCHTAEERHADATALVILDDALTLLRWGVAAECRPAPAALRVAREAVRGYLDASRSAHVSPAEEEPPPPDLASVRGAGIPADPDDAFRAAGRELGERRRLLLGLLQSDARSWPSAPSAPHAER
jgi:hypothetical protein